MRRFESQVKPDEMLMVGLEGQNDAEVLRNLRSAMQTGEILTGYCVKAQADGSLVISLSKTITGIIPREEVSYRVEKDGQVHLGKSMSRVGLNVQFKVMELKMENDVITPILSRKEAVGAVREQYKKDLKVGDIVKGVVIGIQNWGAFVDIGGDVAGVLATPDISRVFIKHPAEVIQVGQFVDVVVTDIKQDGDDIKVSFSRKDLLPDWKDIGKHFKEGDVVLGRVKTIIDTGIFIEIDESFEGLADFIPERTFKYGDTVRVKITSIQVPKHKLKLRIL